MRHTRGGLNASSARDATWEARAARSRLKGGSCLSAKELEFGYAPGEVMAEKGWAGCWCHGELCEWSRTDEGCESTWVGKADGLPHPRTLEELATRIEKELEK